MKITIEARPGERSAEMQAALALQAVAARVLRGEREGTIDGEGLHATFEARLDEEE